MASHDPDDEGSSATGETVPISPTDRSGIAGLRNRSAGNLDQLVEWAKTPAEQALRRTDFVVTERRSL
jgi:hypothetical protein